MIIIEFKDFMKPFSLGIEEEDEKKTVQELVDFILKNISEAKPKNQFLLTKTIRRFLYDGEIKDYITEKRIFLSTKMTELKIARDREVDGKIYQVRKIVLESPSTIKMLNELINTIGLSDLETSLELEPDPEPLDYCGVCGSSISQNTAICSHCDCEVKRKAKV